MIRGHVRHDLAAYLHRELLPSRAKEVSEHLLSCGRCRTELDEARAAAELLAELPLVESPRGAWERVVAGLADDGATKRARPRLNRRLAGGLAAAAVLVIAAFVAGTWVRRHASPSWDVEALAGAPRIASRTVVAHGLAGAGERIVTDATSRARLHAGAVGSIELEPSTRLVIIEASAARQRLSLEEGTLHARTWAPPRLLVVDTPSASAVDLGCAYTLTVDAAGAAVLRVDSGWVALEDRGVESLVPAGAACRTRPGHGPGTPCFEDAPDALRRALDRFDFDRGGAPALAVVLVSARPRDTLTLWHLVARTEMAERPQVVRRLAELAPPPREVTLDDVLRLDQRAMKRWKEVLENTW